MLKLNKFLIYLFLVFFLSLSTYISAYNWQNVTIMGGGFVPGLVYSPAQRGLIYARTDVGGFYRWNNSASQWVPLTDMFGPAQGTNFGGESIAPDPINPNIVYAAAGMNSSIYGTIFSSTDQGNSWTANPIAVSMAANNDGREAGERLAVDPNLTSKLYFGSRWHGLWVSTNSAASWSQVTNFPVNGDLGFGISYVIFNPSGTFGTPSQNIYAGVMAMSSGNSNIYRSINGGTSWSLVPGGPTNMITPRASLGKDGNLWIVYDSGGYGPNGISTGQIWKLNTTTLGWTNVTPSGGPCNGCGGYSGISVDPNNSNHAVVTTIDWWSGPDKLFSTSDGGNSWTIIALPGSGYSTFNDNGAFYTTACGTTQGGTGWAACVAIDPFNSNNAVYTSGGAAPGGGIWSSTNILANPVPWIFTDMGLEEGVCIYMNPSSAGGILFSCMGDFGGMRHTNLAQSPASGMYCNPQFSNTNMLDFAESNPNIVVRVGNSGAITTDVAYSNNNGLTWTPWGSAPPGYTSNNNMGSVAVSADGTHIVVAPYSGKGSPAYASSPGGTWTTCTGLPSGSCVASDRSNAAIFYATNPANWVFGGTVDVYESTDSGVSFSKVNTISVQWNDPNGNGQFVVPRPVFGVPGEFWVSTYDNLYRFTNGGSIKTQISNVYEPFGIGFGKAASGQSHPAVYLSGTVNGIYGFYRCDDGVGTAWTRINDDNHQFGGAGWVEGDETVYGRCYFGAGARGILYCDSATTPTNTTTKTPTNTSTNTPVITNTFTQTRTATFTTTNSPTGTWTQLAGATATNTCTATATFTATDTATSTVTVVTSTNTVTSTITYTNTFTFTVTDTLTFTPTDTSTPTKTISFTHTASPTETIFNGSPTDTPIITETFTGTRTNTETNTPTITSTSTGTQTVSETITTTLTITVNTPTFTFSATLTQTPTNVIFTATGTPTFTVTYSITCTSTQSIQPTVTLTSSKTLTLTFTLTPTFTVTITNTFTETVIYNTPSPILTLTITSATTAKMEIINTFPYPNPCGPGVSITISYMLTHDATDITFKLYTTSARLIRKQTVTGTISAGQRLIAVKPELLSNLSEGIYYYVLEGKAADKTTAKSKIGKIILIK